MENYVKSLELNASIRTTLGTPLDTKDNYVYLFKYIDIYMVDAKVTQCLKCRIDA